MKPNFGSLALVALLLSAPVAPQTGTDHASHHTDASADSTAAPLSDGVVRKVDKSAGRITIKHGPLQHLDMPAMTMVFRVQDPALLDQLKEGDKIKFSVDRINGALTVTEVQVVPQ